MIDYEIHGNQLIRAPFMVMEWADGESLHWRDTSQTGLSRRQKVIQAVAEASLDLLRIQRPGQLCTTSVSQMVSNG